MSDFATANLLIENMDAGLDGPLSSREVACVEKGWMHGEKSASAELTRLQSEVERLRGRCEELEADQQYAKGTLLCPKWAKSQVLIKQAEAVEACQLEMAIMCETDPERIALDYAQRLRQQAAESENGAITRKTD